MKIIEAYWDKDNLKKSTVEITLEINDDVDSINRVLNKMNFEYSVLKLPSRKPEFIHYATERGFMFAETQVSIYKNIAGKYHNELETFLNKFDFKKITEDADLNQILDNIDNDMFSTDRISLDSLFGVEVANRRYRNWLITENNQKQTDIFRICKKNNDVGFVMTKTNPNHVNILLGGIYTKFHNCGYGACLVYKPIEFYRKLGKTTIRTKISSNNQDIIKIYISAGYQIENLEYVFVKHLNCT